MMGPAALLTVVVLSVFVGFEVVSKVTSKLHTPLMSGANAIHGIILVGAIIVAGQAGDPWVLGLALLAVVLATANLVGGFVVTDRMLEMFSARKAPRRPVQQPGDRPARAGAAGERPSGERLSGEGLWDTESRGGGAGGGRSGAGHASGAAGENR